jgi:hypothetical protein
MTGNLTGKSRNRPLLRRAVLYAVIGSFSLAALMGVVALLAGGRFGQTEGRILSTTLVIGLGSLAVLCCLSTLDTRFRAVGVVGALSVLVPVVSGLYLVWGHWDEDPGTTLLRVLGVGTTVAGTFAQVCLLLAAAGGARRMRALLWTTVALAVAMAVVITSLVMEWLDGGEHWRWIGVLAILDVLGTIVTIALARFGARREPAAAPDGGPRSVRLPADLADAVDRRAAETRSTPERVIEAAVAAYLAGSDEDPPLDRPDRPSRPETVR